MIEQVEVLCQHAFGEIAGECEAGSRDADAMSVDVSECDAFSINFNGLVGWLHQSRKQSNPTYQINQMNLKKTDLPAFALFKINAHHSMRTWLAYQSSVSQVRLLQFNLDSSIKQVYILDVPPEPIQAIRLAFDEETQAIYVGIAFHTKFMVLKKNQLVAQFTLTLNCNIVDFENGFIGTQGISDGRQVYFIFITAQGRIITQPVTNVDNRAVIDVNTEKDRVSSFCAVEGWGFVGSQSGAIMKVDLNTRKTVGKYYTKSQLPIINMRLGREMLILGTCDGQIHLLSHNLEVKAVVTAHSGMVLHLHAYQNSAFSSGDDGVLRIWEVEEGKLVEKGFKEYGSRVNMVFMILGKGFVNFYESMRYEEI